MKLISAAHCAARIFAVTRFVCRCGVSLDSMFVFCVCVLKQKREEWRGEGGGGGG